MNDFEKIMNLFTEEKSIIFFPNQRSFMLEYFFIINRISIFVNIISINSSQSFVISNSQLIDNPLNDIKELFNAPVYNLVNFCTPRVIHINAFIKDKINNFVNKYNYKLPQINKLNAVFRSFENGSYIIIYPTLYPLYLDIEEYDKIICYLKFLETGSSRCFEESAQFSELFHDFLSKYLAFSADGEKNRHYGESRKEYRICRYCGLSMPDVTFRNKAHTIPEGLGNKTIITNTECDSCNIKFGQSIELEFIEYMNIFNVFFNIKGKTGERTFKGKNFEMKCTNNGLLVLNQFLQQGETFTINDTDKLPQPKLYSNIKISAQDLYRAISKFAIGIIPENQLDTFSETIEWICKRKSFSTLPKIASLMSYSLFVEHPTISAFIRRIDDQTLPYAFCLFKFTCLTYIAILPTSEGEAERFSLPENYNNFKNFIPFLSRGKWDYSNWSSDERQDLIFNLAFNPLPTGAEPSSIQ